MNGLERVFATVMEQPKDHLAVSLTLSLYGARLAKCDLFEYYNSADKYFEGMSAVKERFNPDILFTPFVMAAEGECFGSKVKYLPNNPPNVTKPFSILPQEIIDMTFPEIDIHPRLRYFKDATRLMVKNFGKENAIAGVMVSPVDLPPLIMGLDGWLNTILFHEKEARLICEKTTEYFVKRANSFFDDGVHFIALPVVFCNPAIVTKNIIENLVLPFFRDAFSRVKGPIVIHHGGNTINGFLDSLAGLPNVAAFVIDQKDKLEVSREIIGNTKVLLGNIDGPTLNRFSVPHLELLCRQIIKNRNNDSHFILSTSSADIPFDTPPENIDVILNAARHFTD